MTQLFGHFTSPDVQVHVPGAAFLAASLLTWSCLGIYWFATRLRPVVAPTGLEGA